MNIVRSHHHRHCRRADRISARFLHRPHDHYQKLLGVESNDFTKLFTVGIQLGAILAVVVLYWKNLLPRCKPGTGSFM